MTFTRTIKQTFEAVQYDGTNIKEVFDFICKYHGNANGVSFEELTTEGKRPEDISLDEDGMSKYDTLMNRWETSHLKGYLFRGEEACLTKEEREEWLNLQNIRLQDWRIGEEYHIYITKRNKHCRLIGIKKGDWFVYGIESDYVIDNYSKETFTNMCTDEGWGAEIV